MKRLFLTSLICLMLTPTSALLQVLSGKVVSIADKSPITIPSGKTQHKVRLYVINTLEKRQMSSKAPKKYTSKLVTQKTGEAAPYDTEN